MVAKLYAYISSTETKTYFEEHWEPNTTEAHWLPLCVPFCVLQKKQVIQFWKWKEGQIKYCTILNFQNYSESCHDCYTVIVIISIAMQNNLYVPLFYACIFLHIFQAQLNAMHLSRLHSATVAPSPAHLSHRLQSGEARPCSRSSHVGNNEAGMQSTCERRPHAIPTIPEVHEPLERKARFRSRNVMSLVGVIYMILLYNW